MSKKKKELRIAVDERYVRDIVTDEELLSYRCDEISLPRMSKQVQEIILEMKNTIRKHNLKGLSANQIDYAGRIICLNFDGDIRTYINPIITKAEGVELSRETCSSIPGKTFIRIRNTKIEIMYQTPLAKIETAEFVGMAARIMQHHMDHLDGILVSDIGFEIDEDFDNATEEERQQVIEAYLDALDMAKENIDKDIKEDEEAQKFFEAIKFTESVQKGETVVENFKVDEKSIKEE